MPGIVRPKHALGDLCLVNKVTDQVHPLNDQITKIGRDQANEISIANDASISRSHACVMFVQDGYWLEDLGSTNGTFLNGRRIKGRKQVYHGDHIVVGKTEMVVIPVRGGSGIREYEIIQEVGRGGMGVVFMAMDHKHNRTVAIKQLVVQNLEPDRLKARMERFKRETVIAQRLNHPNIVMVYDVHLGPGDFYYVMEFLDGRSLRKEMMYRGGRLSPREYLPILEQVASALDYAHGKRIVHRDVKPDNIFLMPDGTVKLTDFGIARLMEDLDGANLTRSGAILGTLAYSAPEQLDNAKRVDHKADIFSLGTVTYEALAGMPPFQGHGITDIVVAVASTHEKPLNEVVPDIHPDIAAAVAKSMAKRPADRYRSVAEFAQQFRQSLESSDQ